jgi:hypothetical protein
VSRIVPVDACVYFSFFFFKIPSQSPKLKISALKRQNFKSPKYEVLQVSDGQENVIPDISVPFASSAKSIPVLSIHAIYHNCLKYLLSLDCRRNSIHQGSIRSRSCTHLQSELADTNQESVAHWPESPQSLRDTRLDAN